MIRAADLEEMPEVRNQVLDAGRSAAELAEQVLKMPVRVGVPTGCFSGLEDRLMDPAFSTAMGLVLMGVEELTGSARYDDLANPRYEDVAGRMKGWIEALF